MFTLKLAINNLQKNKQTVLPYILTSVFSVMMIYLIRSFAANEGLNEMIGGGQMGLILGLGNWVMTFFTVFFLFYTHSFLMRRRKKELGLFNILGMEKRHLAVVLAMETIILLVISLVLGLLAGVLFSQVMFQLLLMLLKVEIPLRAAPNFKEMISTAILFAILFGAILLNSLRQVQLSKPIELLKGDKVGEKEPKANAFLALVGIVCLALAYWISLKIQNPMEAILWFFVAVLLVIVGTHAFFTSASVFILKLLKRNERFYYQLRNFTSISGLIYRMKQNAAGLANICILSTCVLVLLSTTISMYLGMETTINKSFPKEIVVTSRNVLKEEAQQMDQIIDDIVKSHQIEAINALSYRYYTVNAEVTGNSFTRGKTAESSALLMIMPIEEYNRLVGESLTLEENEVFWFDRQGKTATPSMTIFGNEFYIKDHIKEMPFDETEGIDLYDSYVMFVANDEVALNIAKTIKPELNGLAYYHAFDIEDKSMEQMIFQEIDQSFNDAGLGAIVQNKDEARVAFYSLYGGLLFIGIFLGSLFIIATVLIIYYKQISEGYDDQSRFQIMQKVGMSHTEVKKTIHTQVLMVFFLPLLFAFMHIAFAYNIITKMLVIFNLGDNTMFLIATLGIGAVFALFYIIVYSFTAKMYYQIVQ